MKITNDIKTADKSAETGNATRPIDTPISVTRPWYYNDLPGLPTSLQLLKAPALNQTGPSEREDVPALSPDSVSLGSIGKLARQSFNFYWQHQRSAVTRIATLTAGAAAATVGMVYLNANLSAAASKLIAGSEGGSLAITCGVFSMIVLTSAASQVIGFMRQGLNLRTNQASQRIARDELTAHSELLPIDKATGQKNADTSLLIFQNLWEKTRIPDASSNAFYGTIQVGISAALLAQSYPLIAAALVVSAIPTLASSLNRSLERCRTDLDFVVTTRLGWMREWMLGSPKDLIPFRRLGEVPRLKELRNDVVDPSNEALKRLDNRDIAGSSVAAALQFAAVGVAGYCILATDLASGTSLGSTLGSLGLVISAAAGMTGLMKGVSELAKSLLIMKPFYDFVDENRALRKTEDARLKVPDFSEAPGIKLNAISYATSEKTILDNISLEIVPGEILGICGPSGHGKSTLVKIIQGMLTPTSGQVLATVGGITYDIHQAKTDTWNNQIASLAQGDRIMDGFSIRDNLIFGNRTSAGDTETTSKGVIDIGALLSHMKARLSTMVGDGWFGGIRPSGGENQKLLLGRALTTDKKIVVLDEPLNGIDVTESKELQKKIIAEARTRGDTLIFVTHGLSDLRTADRIIVIKDGKIDDQGSPAELAARPGFYGDGAMLSLKETLQIFDENAKIVEDDFSMVIRIMKHRPVETGTPDKPLPGDG